MLFCFLSFIVEALIGWSKAWFGIDRSGDVWLGELMLAKDRVLSYHVHLLERLCAQGSFFGRSCCFANQVIPLVSSWIWNADSLAVLSVVNLFSLGCQLLLKALLSLLQLFECVACRAVPWAIPRGRLRLTRWFARPARRAICGRTTILQRVLVYGAWSHRWGLNAAVITRHSIVLSSRVKTIASIVGFNIKFAVPSDDLCHTLSNYVLLSWDGTIQNWDILIIIGRQNIAGIVLTNACR